MLYLSALSLQVLLTCNAPGPKPLRFGFPLPAKHLSTGLRAQGPVGLEFQWRKLQARPDPVTGRVWVEICLLGGASGGRVRIRPGSIQSSPDRGGPVVSRRDSKRVEEGREVHDRIWRWRGGPRDRSRHLVFVESQDYENEEFDAGEGHTEGLVPGRFLAAGIRPSIWRQAGVLPLGGSLGRVYRRRLCKVAARLVSMRGVRGRGDYLRSKDVVTNLEFDMTLAMARLGLSEGKSALLRRAFESAYHSIDHDLDARTNLLYRHGQGHRSGKADLGHTWLSGVLLVGCLAADDYLLTSCRRIARGLARHPAVGTGRDDLVRESGWPLLEMESYLRFADDPEVAGAVASLIARIKKRWDPAASVFRFGEGERRGGVYEDPVWVSCGSLLPGLRAYVARTSDKEMKRMLERAQARVLSLLRTGKPGIPVRTWSVGRKVLSQARMSGLPGLFFLLDGVAPRDVSRCLRRSQIASALGEVPAWDDPDLPTSFAIVGRCAWIYR